MKTKTNCKNPPAFRYTWPGQDEKFICAIHGAAAVRVMQSMGMYLQLIPITVDDLLRYDDLSCSQMDDSDDDEQEE